MLRHALVPAKCYLGCKPLHLAGLTLGCLISCLYLATPVAKGQVTSMAGARGHYLLSAQEPPGAVAHWQISRGRPGVGCYTAVSIQGPEGVQVGLARDGQFLEPIAIPVTTGMLVGAVYRFRVTGIPDWPGEELYPTLEVIDAIHPEPGREHRFPIPVVLTAEDLEIALRGSLVTRVIYLEDSQLAMPLAVDAKDHLTVDVGPGENALRAADQLGRPVAILRIGSRVPSDLSGDLSEFLYGCPPWVPLQVAPDREAMIRQGRWAEVVPADRPEAVYSENHNQDYPRVPLHD